jgi:Flp pilus assembly protein CpaB
MSNPLASRRSKNRDNPSGIALAAIELDRPLLRARSDQSNSSPRPSKRWRLTQPLPLAALLLILLALIGYWSVYNQTTRRTQVLIAAHTLPAGRVLRAADLRPSGLAASRQVLATFVQASERNMVVGRALKAPVSTGAPIPAAALAGGGGGGDSLTLAVPAMHALAGQLAPGDRVTVLATYTSGNGQAQTRAVARNLEVIAVGNASGFAASSQTIPVTVALRDPSLASALALANHAGKLDLLRESGAGANAPIPAASAPGAAP